MDTMHNLDNQITEENSPSHIQFLTFILGNELYGLDILRVQEIRGWEKTTLLPEMPNFIKGVINIRGAIVPIIDLRNRFQIGKATYDETTVVIITRMSMEQDEAGNYKTVGLVVDGVSDVENINMTTLQRVPSFQGSEGINELYIQGVANLHKQDHEDLMVIVLNVDALLGQGIFNYLEAFTEETPNLAQA
ncbi:chemotaxis protein CheW [Hydrogenovibrio sp. JE_KL2]|uniref:chemotaxis protein CheW n=1 Tax=Hydrogenovibrio sp. JE_KL2 TaxID=2651188 RepID=UPI001C12C700|nr:chemotaxis protein CheW [Hydrogenovibrio sp. JE_KL2]